MFKKIILVTLLVGLTGLLIAGAINRTVAKNGSTAEIQEQGYGRNAEVANETGLGRANHESETENVEWLTFRGAVISADAKAFTVGLAGQPEVIVEGRAWSYAQEQGFAVQPGDQIVLSGFYEDGEFKVVQIQNNATGETITIRDERGQPMWSRRGRRGA